nr:hypothetical protein CFP56_04883 [Quercus suber]
MISQLNEIQKIYKIQPSSHTMKERNSSMIVPNTYIDSFLCHQLLRKLIQRRRFQQEKPGGTLLQSTSTFQPMCLQFRL